MLTTRTETLAEGITIHMGDCRDVLPTLARAHAIITDPPYGVGLVGKTGRPGGARLAINLVITSARCVIFIVYFF